MANGYTTISDLLRNDLSVRKEIYGTQEIQYIEIDGNRFGGYKTFSSFWEKTYAKQPERSAKGVIDNLNSYPTFTTFHVKIDFAMMSIVDYRRLYNLMLSKNEFMVKAYNVVDGKTHTCKMYFAPDQMPKLYAVARKLQGSGDKFIEVLGVQDYTIELIGTNADMGKISVIYKDKNDNTIASSEHYLNEEFTLGANVSVPAVNGYNFDGNWKMKGTSLTYPHNSAISITIPPEGNSVTFNAQYGNNRQYILSLNWGMATPVKDKDGNDITALFFTPYSYLGDVFVNNAIETQGGGIFTALPKSGDITQGGKTYVSTGWRKTSLANGTPVDNNTYLNVEGNIMFYQVFEEKQ